MWPTQTWLARWWRSCDIMAMRSRKIRGRSGSVRSCHQTVSGASKNQFYLPFFDTNLSSLMTWNLQSYPTTVLNERMRYCYRSVGVRTLQPSMIYAPVFIVQIGEQSESTKPAIWIDAGIHAREWIAPATAVYIIHEVSRIQTKQIHSST